MTKFLAGPSSAHPARGTLIAAAKEFRDLAATEAERLELEIVRTRDRGYPHLAGDLDTWRRRLARLVVLADAVIREPGVAR